MHCVFTMLLLLLALPATAQVTDIKLKDGNICRGGAIDLGTLIDESPAHVPYSRWKEGNNYLNTSGFSCWVSPTSTTTYTLEYRLSSDGSIQTKDAQVKVWLEPNVTAPADTAVCRGQSIQLLANATNEQEIIWRSGTTTYGNGTVISPIESRSYMFVVTVRNDYCITSASDTMLVTGVAPIRNAVVEADVQPQIFCKGATIDLQSLLHFFVIDDEKTLYPATYLNGTTTWTSNGISVPDPANYKVPDWAVLVATVNATVTYTSVCHGAQTYPVNREVKLYISGIPTAVKASGNYRDCPGDPVDIHISLESLCSDTIKHVNISGNSTNCNLNFSAPRERIYRCSPIPAGATYTVYVETTAIDTTMPVTPSPVDPPNVSGWPDDMCKGDNADFYITTDCDEILSVEWTVAPAGAGTPTWQSSASHSWCFRLTATENATYTAGIKYKTTGLSAETTTFITLPLAIRPSAFYLYASPEEICKGDSAFIAVTSDCDDIVTVDDWNIATPVYVGRGDKMMAYKTTVSQNTTIRARVTYYDRSADMNSSTYVTGQLNVRDYPPTVSPASYNLCRGSADTA